MARHQLFGDPQDHINAVQAVAASPKSPDQSMKAKTLLDMSDVLGSRDDSFG